MPEDSEWIEKQIRSCETDMKKKEKELEVLRRTMKMYRLMCREGQLLESHQPLKYDSFVVSRDGRRKDVNIQAIVARIESMSSDLDLRFVDPIVIAIKVISGLYKGVTTVELDNLAAASAASMSARHPDFDILAARIAASNIHKMTSKVFTDVVHTLYKSQPMIEPIVNEKMLNVVIKYKDVLNSAVLYTNDFEYCYFGLKKLEQLYLFKIGERVMERPQHMIMRLSLAIHGDNIDALLKCYKLLSEKYMIHTQLTPVKYQDCQMSSAFFITSSSIGDLKIQLKELGKISKLAGGIGVNLSKVGVTEYSNAGTSGAAIDSISLIRKYLEDVDQCSVTSPEKITIHLEVWHAEVINLLHFLSDLGTKKEESCDLEMCLWIPNMFMRRVKANQTWSLMCPRKCPNLDEIWGWGFEDVYTKYENNGEVMKLVKARQLWEAILSCQIKTGFPQIAYKDSINFKSNLMGKGTVKCSNSKPEIMLVCSPKDKVGFCNSASIALNRFVTSQKCFDYTKLAEVARELVKNLNKILDDVEYPYLDTKCYIDQYRPIGIGVHGLADCFILMRYPFTSQKAKELNKRIFETIYYAALDESCEQAALYGTYSTYEGSPVSRGILQYDMWGVTPTDQCDWAKLKEKIAKYGVRNSQILAQMSNPINAEVLGSADSIEPYTSNIYSRRVLSGDFQIVNPHLLKDLVELGLWDDDMKNRLIANNGSVQSIEQVPIEIKELYKTVWEISQKEIIDMAADRGAFIDQSQSLNIHMVNPSHAAITSMHFYGWKKGLKCGLGNLKIKDDSMNKVFVYEESIRQLEIKTAPESSDENLLTESS